jgi:hypothetical protein
MYTWGFTITSSCQCTHEVLPSPHLVNVHMRFYHHLMSIVHCKLLKFLSSLKPLCKIKSNMACFSLSKFVSDNPTIYSRWPPFLNIFKNLSDKYIFVLVKIKIMSILNCSRYFPSKCLLILFILIVQIRLILIKKNIFDYKANL